MMRVEDLQATGKRPRVHGNGFIQLDLNDEGTRRLHVWDESIPRQEVATPVHDHVFALKSKVIAGTLIHEVLEPVEGDTHRIFRAQQEEGTQNTILVPDEGTVALRVAERFTLPAGVEYEFPAWELHQTDHVGLTATIMEKAVSHIIEPGCEACEFKIETCRTTTLGGCGQHYGRPRVLVPVGQEPDNEFKRDGHDEKELWLLIEAALLITSHAERMEV